MWLEVVLRRGEGWRNIVHSGDWIEPGLATSTILRVFKTDETREVRVIQGGTGIPFYGPTKGKNYFSTAE